MRFCISTDLFTDPGAFRRTLKTYGVTPSSMSASVDMSDGSSAAAGGVDARLMLAGLAIMGGGIAAASTGGIMSGAVIAALAQNGGGRPAVYPTGYTYDIVVSDAQARWVEHVARRAGWTTWAAGAPWSDEAAGRYVDPANATAKQRHAGQMPTPWSEQRRARRILRTQRPQHRRSRRDH